MAICGRCGTKLDANLVCQPCAATLRRHRLFWIGLVLVALGLSAVLF
jgi:hypothetical protein